MYKHKTYYEISYNALDLILWNYKINQTQLAWIVGTTPSKISAYCCRYYQYTKDKELYYKLKFLYQHRKSWFWTKFIHWAANWR